MKTKINIVLCVILIVLATFLLFSCGECKHEFGDWETVKDATCINKGTIVAYCSLCNHSKTETIDKKDHEEIILEKVAPTCSQTGLTKGIKCKICNEVLVKQEEIPLVEHIFSNNICTVCSVENYSKDLKFDLNSDNSSYKVSLGNCNDDCVIIPHKYNDLPVTLIEKTAFNYGTFKEIIIPNSILTIEASAFKGCNKLEKITIPFVGKSKTATGKEALLGFIFGDVEFDGSYSADQGYTFVVSLLKSHTYYIPNSLTEVVLTGNKLTFGAFHECTSLTSITISSEVEEYPNYCFSETSLKKLNISESVKEIKPYAFRECNNLEEFIVDINNSNYKSIDGNILSKNGETFLHYALGKNEKNYTLPNEVITIAKEAFYSCNKLEQITLPVSLKRIESYAFSKCSSIETLIIPNSVTYIDDYAFSSCSNLQQVFLPAELIFVGEGAFWKLSKGAIIYYAGSIENTNWDDQWNASEYTIIYNSTSIN